jgi:copper(I)-binding protein
MTPTVPSRRRLRVAGALVATAALVLALAACGSDSDSDTATTDTTAATDSSTTAADAGNVVSDEGGLVIADAWARTSPEDTTYGAVYMTLTSEDGDSLVGASVPSDIAGTVEIHETVASGDSTDTTMAMGGGSSDTTDTTMAGMGQMTMRPIDSLELPAGEAVTLEPGGYHIMLIDLVAPLETGQEIEVTLTFENAGERTITVPVQDDAP